MAVVDSLVIKKGSEFLPIDSYDNEMIDEIIYEGQSFHFAKQKDLTGTTEIVADNGVDEPIISLGVNGATLQSGTPTPEAPIPIENANDNGMSMVLHGKNLALATQMFNKNGKYNANVTLDGRNCVRCLQTNTTSHAILGGFKEKTQYTFIFDYAFVRAEGTNVTQNGAIFYIKYTDGSQSVVAWNWQYDKFTKKIYTSTAGKTIKGIGNINADYRAWIYIDKDTFGVYEGAIADPIYEPYFRETIEIPTSIDVDGTNVPLRFSEYDKLTVDRLGNKVVYINGTYVITYDENKINTSSIYLNPQAGTNFYFHRVANSTFLVNGKGLSTHFPEKPWYPLQKNYSFGALSDNNYTNIAFRLTGTETLAEFKQFMIDIANTGNPVIVQAQRFTPIEYDITSTDLGQSLLALATRKGTNYLEISSDLAPSQTDLSYWRQIIPNE